MKGLYFTDIHFGRRSNDRVHNQDCYDFVAWACKRARQLGVDYVSFLGDWFESRNSVDISTLNIGYQAAGELSKLDVPVYFVTGNHDLYKRYSREHFSTVHYGDIPNFVIINEPAIHNDVLFCPFMFEEEYLSLVQYSKTKIWAGHFEFSGFCITGHNKLKEGGPTHNLFKDVDLILSGHFHKRQRQDNTLYIGNAFPLDFSDVNDNERGICILDHDTLETTFEHWTEQPSFYRTKLSKIRTQQFPNKARIKCLLDETINQNDLMLLKASFLETGVRELTFEQQKIDYEKLFTKDQANDASKITNLKQLIYTMIDNIDNPDIDNKLLKKILDDTGEFESFSNNSEEITFVELGMRNFYSYGNNDTVIKLDELGLFNLIYGVNNDVVYDDVDKCSNGAGKSVILNGISYCCYDRVIKDNVTFDDMINNINLSNMMCYSILKKGNTLYQITRRRKCGKNKNINDVTFHEIDSNHVMIKDLTKDSSSNTNKSIKELIGIQFETFTRMVLFSATNTSFFSLPATSSTTLSQTDILEDLFRLLELTNKADNIKKFQKTINDQLTIEKKLVQQQDAINNDAARNYNNLMVKKQQWVDNNLSEIDKLTKELSEIPANIEQIVKDKELFAEITHKRRGYQQALVQFDREFNTLQRNKDSLTKEVQTLEGGKCPYCKQNHSDKNKVNSLKNDIVNIQTQYETIVHAQDLTIEDASAVEKEFKALQYVVQYNNVVDAYTNKSIIESRIEQLKCAANPFIIALDSIPACQVTDYTKVNDLTKQVEHCQFLTKMLTKKDSFVRKALLSQNLPFLNTKVNEYLSLLKLPHVVWFTDELTTKITLNDREFAFSSISNGQIARINIALCLAFRDVLTRQHANINLLMLDECLDVGLSSNGITNALRMLRTKAKDDNLKMLVITHRDEISSLPFDKRIKVMFQDNFSTAQVE